ncbi:extracellular ligand-gated ion channel protein [Senna tora]|uniref:Extracellular ligand-gated ion channel protein n=1 Tax=Senna tora TaxID=362788 RepID=A0A834T8B8_9FABA|nr:extracellular ligand-gated ion channel protein [Senna tora]
MIKPPAKLNRCISYADDELHIFRSYLRWMCLDQSSLWTALMSWSMFLLFAVVVPATSHFLLACPSCDAKHSRPYDAVVQLSLSSVAALSFLCLTKFVKKYGLRRFLFFDKLCDVSETVRSNYTWQLNRSLKILSVFVVPCIIAESAYKIWWYASGASQIPFLGNVYVSDAVACIMELLSWLYRITVIFLVCVLFRLICQLQILRLQDFATVFHMDSDVASVLSEHLRIRRHMRIISHRFRGFILGALMLVTGSQFACLLITTKYTRDVNVYKAGELALCSMTLLSALSVLLRSATKITHKAQAITGLASKWHACATLDSFDGVGEGETPPTQISHERLYPTVGTDGESEADDAGDEEDDIDNTKFIPSYAYSTISYQKRQALVNYFENNKAGITVFGFMLDRSTLHTIFGIELSLVLWLLGKTIGIS